MVTYNDINGANNCSWYTIFVVFQCHITCRFLPIPMCLRQPLPPELFIFFSDDFNYLNFVNFMSPLFFKSLIFIKKGTYR